MDALENIPGDVSTRPASTGDELTFGTIECGVLLGPAVRFADTYFGLQAGIVNVMPMQSDLLGFVIFQAFTKQLSKILVTLSSSAQVLARTL